ncbi:hypothetical protein FN846DRAFT_885758 [Sphaerosporella brunnea]|uniref:Uncharacterized protein n=1 Tax=Sphaerosporella brunnea TaxID=1250544 RepID=A0A5J5FBM0_9PEZI|nr:hypothetical protein FN846DRAFT_885758 [Sphaerosporella brunnea]
MARQTMGFYRPMARYPGQRGPSGRSIQGEYNGDQRFYRQYNQGSILLKEYEESNGKWYTLGRLSGLLKSDEKAPNGRVGSTIVPQHASIETNNKNGGNSGRQSPFPPPLPARSLSPTSTTTTGTDVVRIAMTTAIASTVPMPVDTAFSSLPAVAILMSIGSDIALTMAVPICIVTSVPHVDPHRHRDPHCHSLSIPIPNAVYIDIAIPTATAVAKSIGITIAVHISISNAILLPNFIQCKRRDARRAEDIMLRHNRTFRELWCFWCYCHATRPSGESYRVKDSCSAQGSRRVFVPGCGVFPHDT